MLLTAAELGPAGLEAEGCGGGPGKLLETRDREGARRQSSTELLSPRWRAADSGARSRGGIAAPPSPVSWGPHSWGSGLEVFGATSPTLQQRGTQSLSVPCAGGNTEPEGGGRSLCTGPIPRAYVLPASLTPDTASHNSPSPRDCPHLARCLLTWDSLGPPQSRAWLGWDCGSFTFLVHHLQMDIIFPSPR